MLNEVFLRLLGRAATPREIEATLASLKKLPEEHQRLAARLQREGGIGPGHGGGGRTVAAKRSPVPKAS